MELFIPSLIVLILSALVFFYILPRLSPYVLGFLAFAMFGLGIWQHYSMFPYEYRASMVTDMIQAYSGFVMLLAVIFVGIFTILMLHGENPPAASELLSDIKMPTVFSNSSKSIFNLSGNSSNNGISGVIENVGKTVSNVFKPKNNSGLGSMFGNTGKTNFLASPSFKVT